ncbi:MAG: HNH endonuclease [Spirochaetales bacterium]|nr:HNH endonuclease [Spirochaetales bacterium]
MTSREKKNYRQTKKFKTLRSHLINERGPYCELCGVKRPKGKGLHVHHIDPNAYGNEQPEDLALLCPTCHKHIVERLVTSYRGKSYRKNAFNEGLRTLVKHFSIYLSVDKEARND